MKRQDVFPKLHTICQRLDEVDLATFPIVPLRLYLFGSVLTDKPKPAGLDLILIYRFPPHYDGIADRIAMSYGKPTARDRASIDLRRGMRKVQIYLVEVGLGHYWGMQPVLLVTRPRLIWQPSGDWRTALAKIEADPLPWIGGQKEANDAYLRSLSEEEYEVRLQQAVTEIEGQEI